MAYTLADVAEKPESKKAYTLADVSEKPSIVSKASNVVQKVAGAFTYPLTGEVPKSVRKMVPSPAVLQRGGEKVKKSVNESLGNIASKASEMGVPPEVSALVATGGSMLADLPFTPQEMSVAIGGEAAVPAIYGKSLREVPKEIMNRWANAPASLAEDRLRKGLPTMGEEFLKSKPSSYDKKEIYESAKKGIQAIGNQVKKEVDNVVKTGGNRDYIDKSSLAENPEALNNVIDDMIGSIQKWDTKGEATKLLTRVKNSAALDFKTANQFRELIGDYIGRGFRKEEAPEKIMAMRDIFGSLRQKIGEISPMVDNLLKAQHGLYQRGESVFKEVARGYPKASTVFETLVSRNPRLATAIESAGNTRGVGGLAYAGSKLAQSYSPDLKKGAKTISDLYKQVQEKLRK